jgi:hypothetical protein
MGDGRTFLSPVVATGGIWRVRMTWPNGTVRHFGKFTSEKEAIEGLSGDGVAAQRGLMRHI